MKTFNFLKTKSLVKKFTKVGVIALVLASCGDKNAVDSNNTVGNQVINSPVYQNPAISPAWNQLKQQMPCLTAGARTDVALTVAAPQQGYGNQISGQLTQGQAQGSPQGTYLGVDYFTGDLMAATKVTNGSSSAYNIVISMCAFNQSGKAVIGGGAQLSNFQIYSPIRIAESAKAYGDILAGSIGFRSSASQMSLLDNFAPAPYMQ